MASTDSIPVPRKNTAFRLYFTVRDSAGAPVTGFTSPDSEVSKDGGAFADCTNEATYVGHGNGYIDLTSTEMNADSVCYYMSCTEGNIDIAIAPEELGDVRVNAGQVGGQTASASGTVTFPNATLASTTNITSASGVAVTSIATDAISAAAVAAAAVTKIQSGLATPTNITAGTITTVTNLTNAPTSGDLTATMKSSVTAAVPSASTIAAAVWNALSASWSAVTGSFGKLLEDMRPQVSNVNTNVTLVKDKTDQFVFTVANRVDATAQSGLSTLDAAGVRDAVGMASANLDTQLSGINAKTTNLPSLPAAVGSAMTLANDAISAASLSTAGVAKIQNGLSTLAASDVLTKVNEALDTAIAELGIGTPATTPTLRTGLMLLYMRLLNNSKDTSTKRFIRNAAGTTIAEATLDTTDGIAQGKLASP